jgi:hypothetical protein
MTSDAPSFWAGVDVRGPDDCWEWQGSRDATGYGLKRWHGKVRRTHRIAYQIAHDVTLPVQPPTKECVMVLHSCDNRPCCNPAHLSLGLHADNRRDCVTKGRHRSAPGDANGSRKHPERLVRGEAHHDAVLTRADVLAIRAKLAAGGRPTWIGRDYGVSRHAITAIKTGRSWAHVK